MIYDTYTEWCNLDDERHRENGPAIEWTNGSRIWYINGRRHRENGPAIEYADGYGVLMAKNILKNLSMNISISKTNHA